MRKIFIDGGAHNGCSVELFVKNYPDYKEFEIYSFECDENRYDELVKKGQQLKLSNFHPIKKAIWVEDGFKRFDGWALENHTDNDGSGVESINISKFILDNFSKEDYIVLKLDIEGAEYRVVDKMTLDGSLAYISKFYGELHGPKKGYSIEQNNKLINQIWDNNLKLENWDALEGGLRDLQEGLEIVPFNTSGSFLNGSSHRVGHAYRKIKNYG